MAYLEAIVRHASVHIRGLRCFVLSRSKRVSGRRKRNRLIIPSQEHVSWRVMRMMNLV